MEVAQVKLELFRFIDNLNENILMQLYKNLITQSNEKDIDFWNTLNEWQKKDIEEGIADLDNGKKKDFNKVISKYK